MPHGSINKGQISRSRFVMNFLWFATGILAIPKGQASSMSHKRIDLFRSRPSVNGQGHDATSIHLAGSIHVLMMMLMLKFGEMNNVMISYIISTRVQTHLQECLFTRSGCISGNERHDAFASSRTLFACQQFVVAGMLLSVPFQKEAIAGIQEWSKELQQGQIGIGAGDTALHDFQVAWNLPILDLCHTTIVLDVLWIKIGKHFGKEWIQIVGRNSFFNDQMP